MRLRAMCDDVRGEHECVYDVCDRARGGERGEGLREMVEGDVRAEPGGGGREIEARGVGDMTEFTHRARWSDEDGDGIFDFGRT